jgi:hypothetical protein
MKKFISFTKIGQYRHIIRNVCHVPEGEVRATHPTLTFEGAIKLHGTNAGICHTPADGIWYQSRKNIITPEKDNAGFAFFASNRKDFWYKIFDYLHKDGYITTIFGEWCGGNIQTGVALNHLSKRFVVFAIKYTGIEDEADHFYTQPDFMNEDLDVYNIFDFLTYELEIDFNYSQIAQAEMIKLVDEVEEECPFSKHFDAHGIGEGIVWSHYDENGHRDHIFKTKGEKHSASKVKTVAPVDIEKMNSVNEFVEYAVTENRLNQAIEQVFTSASETPRIQMMSDFLKWVNRDIIMEEMDVLNENGLEPKDVGKAMSVKARMWFMNYLDKVVME